MIEDLISRVFWTRNLAHIAHWATGSYAQHQALGSFYDDIIGNLDGIVEAYQGAFTKVKPYTGKLSVPPDLISHLETEVAWIQMHREEIARENSAIENLIDGLCDTYLTTLYKLKNLS